MENYSFYFNQEKQTFFALKAGVTITDGPDHHGREIWCGSDLTAMTCFAAGVHLAIERRYLFFDEVKAAFLQGLKLPYVVTE